MASQTRKCSERAHSTACFYPGEDRPDLLPSHRPPGPVNPLLADTSLGGEGAHRLVAPPLGRELFVSKSGPWGASDSFSLFGPMQGHRDPAWKLLAWPYRFLKERRRGADEG